MSEEQNRDKSGGTPLSGVMNERKTLVEESQAGNNEQTKQDANSMSGEPVVVEGAELTKAGGAGEPPGGYAAVDNEKAATSSAASASRVNTKTAKSEEVEAETPKEPSPNQPLLDRLVSNIREFNEDAIEEAFINEKGGHIPYVIIKGSTWPAVADHLKSDPKLKLDYLRNVSGIDMETHFEVAYHLLSLENRHEYCVKIKTDREKPSIPSVTPIWPTANWNEREIYDLFGIDFPGHPDLRRIMMSDDWVGHPLRKDYEPLDPEV